MPITKRKVAIVGAAGYTGEELIRLIIRHPHLELTTITSRENQGNPLSSVFPRYSHLDIKFTSPTIENIENSAEIIFLCLPHGLAGEYAKPLLESGLTVIDISADFRLKNSETYKKYYHKEHPAADLLSLAVYGLPEKNRNLIVDAQLIACPGCYPTSIILPLFPLLKEKIIRPTNIIVSSMSGVTGAGRKNETPYLFAECNESIRPYSIINHRHKPEIEQELMDFTDGIPVNLTFTPHLVPINRGICSTIFLEPIDAHFEIGMLERIYREFYQAEPFIRILPHGTLSDTKNVFHTNFCEIGFDYDPISGKIILTSAIDNLTKGAAGQAIQCLNILCNYNEMVGLM